MSLLSNAKLEEQLSAAGKSILRPPSSLDELLTLLDRIEELLSKVAQSPSKSMQTVLSPLMKALISEKLMKHSDVDVQVGVAACISEIIRITAPDAPYDDEKMKDVFQLIVSSFDNFSDTSSRSHQKRATILETVAKIRSCVIMLDLELDQMIIEMFQHFLNSIRVYHAKGIFTSMETIMSLVFEESEDISPDLLNPILDTLKKNNEEVLPIAKNLAKRVIQNGADKLRPCLTKAIDNLSASLDDYNEVVASVCQKNFGLSDENILEDQMVAKDVKEEIKPQDKDLAEDVKEEFKPQEKDHALNPKSIHSNNINETGKGENMTDEIVLEEVKSKQQFDATSTSKSVSDDMGTQKAAHLEVKADYGANGDTQPFPNNSAELSDLLKDGKQEEQIPCHQEFPSEQIQSPVDAEKHLDTVKDTVIQLSPSIESQILSSIHPDKNQPKRSGRTKRKENIADTSSKNAPGASIAEGNKKHRTMKYQHGEIIGIDKALGEVVNKNDAVGFSDSEARYMDLREKLGDASNKIDDGSSSKENRRKGGRVEPKFEKDTSKYSATEDNGKVIAL